MSSKTVTEMPRNQCPFHIFQHVLAKFNEVSSFSFGNILLTKPENERKQVSFGAVIRVRVFKSLCDRPIVNTTKVSGFAFFHQTVVMV